MYDEETKQDKPKQPENMVVYDPDRVPRQRWHACVLLRKVNDALHEDPDPSTSVEDEPDNIS